MNKFVVLLLIIIEIAFIGILLYFFPYASEVSSSLQAIGVCGALLISLVALVYAVLEFQHHKKSAATALICQYIQRYANDKNTQLVQQYILETALIDEKTGKIVGFNKEAKPSYTPSIRQKELFMHVFEELQLCIDAKMISQSTAIDLFGYYVSVFHQIEEFHSDITDYYNENFFRNYLKFANSIPEGFHLR